VVVAGNVGLTRTGPGVVSLTANNTYTGGTSISGGGVLRVTTGNNALGDVSGNLSFNDGTLRLGTAAFTTSRTVNLIGNGTNEVTATSSATMNGPISGNGGLTKTGSALMTI